MEIIKGIIVICGMLYLCGFMIFTFYDIIRSAYKNRTISSENRTTHPEWYENRTKLLFFSYHCVRKSYHLSENRTIWYEKPMSNINIINI